MDGVLTERSAGLGVRHMLKIGRSDTPDVQKRMDEETKKLDDRNKTAWTLIAGPDYAHKIVQKHLHDSPYSPDAFEFAYKHYLHPELKGSYPVMDRYEMAQREIAERVAELKRSGHRSTDGERKELNWLTNRFGFEGLHDRFGGVVTYPHLIETLSYVALRKHLEVARELNSWTGAPEGSLKPFLLDPTAQEDFTEFESSHPIEAQLAKFVTEAKEMARHAALSWESYKTDFNYHEQNEPPEHIWERCALSRDMQKEGDPTKYTVKAIYPNIAMKWMSQIR